MSMIRLNWKWAGFTEIVDHRGVTQKLLEMSPKALQGLARQAYQQDVETQIGEKFGLSGCASIMPARALLRGTSLTDLEKGCLRRGSRLLGPGPGYATEARAKYLKRGLSGIHPYLGEKAGSDSGRGSRHVRRGLVGGPARRGTSEGPEERKGIQFLLYSGGPQVE